jgi:tRNA dimethylallyltransferase
MATRGEHRPETARPPAIFLMGPTASGKTTMAVKLAQRFPLDLISVDSALVYRGMDIGTAKPDAATLAQAPHRLLDIRDPAESYSAAEFRQDAVREMARIGVAGRTPLLVGGTMLYFRALSGGLARLPAANPAVRKRLATEAGKIGWVRMHDRLAGLDPAAALRIHPNDPQRIQRALEVIELSGRKLSDLQAEHQHQQEQQCGYRILRLVLCPKSRQVLHQRIEKRFHSMLEQGFIDEVSSLRARGDLTPELPALRCVGYRQAWRHLDGEISSQEMTRQAIAATRQLAKRQLTWLRQVSGAVWYDLEADSAQESVFEEVAGFLEL